MEYIRTSLLQHGQIEYKSWKQYCRATLPHKKAEYHLNFAHITLILYNCRANPVTIFKQQQGIPINITSENLHPPVKQIELYFEGL